MAISTLTFMSSCDEDDDDLPKSDPTEERKSSGFVVNAQTPEGTAIVKYFDELPTGDVDVSDGTDFQQFFPVDGFASAIYLARPSGDAGFSKIMVDGNGDIIEDAFLSVVDESSFQIAIKDANTGILHDRNTPNRLTVFNPEDMTVSGTIDMSAAFVPSEAPHRYQTFYFRGDEVFAPLRGNAGEIYDSLVVHVANFKSGNYVSTLTYETGAAAPFNDYGQNDVDEMGNLYISHQGDVGGGNPASILKIPAGNTEFDPDYNFRAANVLNPANFFLPIFRGFRYVGNGKAIALVATDTPQAAIDLVTVAGGVQNLSSDEIQQVLGILFSAENARWSELDLEAQTVTPIDGLPSQSVFATTVVMESEGQLYLPITTPSINALYSYDVNSKATAKVFDLVAGGALVGVYNLGQNN